MMIIIIILSILYICLNGTKDDLSILEKELNNKLVELSNQEMPEVKDYKVLLESKRSEYFSKAKELEDKVLNHETNLKIAYLTFDDGPYYKTYEYLRILKENDIQATFFTTSINGEMCFDKKDVNCMGLYKEYLKGGHTIGNHTYTHSIGKGLYKSVNTFINSLKQQEEHIKNMTGGYITNIVRFPGGSGSAKKHKVRDGAIEKLKELGYGWVDWTAQDGDGINLSNVEDGMKELKETINADIEVILLHDYNKYTLALLPDAIAYLKSEGYIFLPLFYESSVINK